MEVSRVTQVIIAFRWSPGAFELGEQRTNYFGSSQSPEESMDSLSIRSSPPSGIQSDDTYDNHFCVHLMSILTPVPHDRYLYRWVSCRNKGMDISSNGLDCTYSSVHRWRLLPYSAPRHELVSCIIAFAFKSAWFVSITDPPNVAAKLTFRRRYTTNYSAPWSRILWTISDERLIPVPYLRSINLPQYPSLEPCGSAEKGCPQPWRAR